jgi:hypothetical protein
VFACSPGKQSHEKFLKHTADAKYKTTIFTRGLWAVEEYQRAMIYRTRLLYSNRSERVSNGSLRRVNNSKLFDLTLDITVDLPSIVLVRSPNHLARGCFKGSSHHTIPDWGE